MPSAPLVTTTIVGPAFVISVKNCDSVKLYSPVVIGVASSSGSLFFVCFAGLVDFLINELIKSDASKLLRIKTSIDANDSFKVRMLAVSWLVPGLHATGILCFFAYAVMIGR